MITEVKQVEEIDLAPLPTGEEILTDAKRENPRGERLRSKLSSSLIKFLTATSIFFGHEAKPSLAEILTPSAPIIIEPTIAKESVTGVFLTPKEKGELKEEEAARRNDFLKSESIHGIKVYGLEGQIRSESDAQDFYRYVNDRVVRQLPPNMKNISKVAQREYIIGKDVRAIEFVITRSAYDSFETRRDETGADFVEWAQAHIDLFNRMIENAKPTSQMRVKLQRVVVIEDTVAEKWREEKRSGRTGDAFDWYWQLNVAGHVDNKYPIDIDTSWAISHDYRQRYSRISSFMQIDYDQNGNIIVTHDDGRRFTFPTTGGVLQMKRIKFNDPALIHELSHQATNLSDEYIFNWYEMPYMFKRFRFDTSYLGSPEMSPFLSFLLERNRKFGVRGYIHPDNFPEMIFQTPESIELSFPETLQKIEVSVARLGGNYYSQKNFPESPDEIFTNTSSIRIEDLLDPTLYGMRVIHPPLVVVNFVREGKTKELIFPLPVFVMSSFSGIEDAKYEIEFGADQPNKNTQIVQLVDESDLSEYLEEREAENDPPYAMMKIPGTSTYCVWLLRYEMRQKWTRGGFRLR